MSRSCRYALFPILASLGCIVSSGRAATEVDKGNNAAAYTGEQTGTKASSMVVATGTVATNTPATVVVPPPVSSQPTGAIQVTVNETKVSTLTTADLKEYADQPASVQRLIAQGLTLTQQNLGYKYGSADPKNGGMDCSGTVYYLLQQAGIPEVPRDASGLYSWVWKQNRFRAVVSQNPETFELQQLKPGDLLFWTGTYRVDRDPPVTHVMIYLGTNRQTGHRVMVGASEGRPFDGKSRYGVSVFDFQLSGANRKQGLVGATLTGTEMESRFIGYGSIPGLEQTNSSTAAPLASTKG